MIYFFYFSIATCLFCGAGWLIKTKNPYLVFAVLGVLQFVLFKILTNGEDINIVLAFGLTILAILTYDRIQSNRK